LEDLKSTVLRFITHCNLKYLEEKESKQVSFKKKPGKSKTLLNPNYPKD